MSPFYLPLCYYNGPFPARDIYVHNNTLPIAANVPHRCKQISHGNNVCCNLDKLCFIRCYSSRYLMPIWDFKLSFRDCAILIFYTGKWPRKWWNTLLYFNIFIIKLYGGRIKDVVFLCNNDHTVSRVGITNFEVYTWCLKTLSVTQIIYDDRKV